MAEFNQVLWALDNEIQPRSFERLCVDLLGREGYHHIVPIGGSKDHGRDAEFRCWKGASNGHAVVAFQFSLQESWEKKLQEDTEKTATHCPDAVAMVFVTSQEVTGAKQDRLREEFRSQRGWHFTVYSREWLRHRLTEFHQDLAKKYFSLALPPTVGYAATLVDLSDLEEESFAEAFRQTSPELVRASILESTRKEPAEIGNWYRLAQIEFLLRNYSAALQAVTKALQLKPRDPVAVINMTNFKGAVSAELGTQDHSRPLMIEAKNIFQNAVSDFQAGFQSARLYRRLRQKLLLEDHCITLHGYGLNPSIAMLAALNYALIAPFGVLVHEIRGTGKRKSDSNMQRLFTATLNTIFYLFPLFGARWLAKAKPSESDERVKLLSLGIVYLTDVVVAETARLVGFVAGNSNVPNEIVGENQKEK